VRYVVKKIKWTIFMDIPHYHHCVPALHYSKLKNHYPINKMKYRKQYTEANIQDIKSKLTITNSMAKMQFMVAL